MSVPGLTRRGWAAALGVVALGLGGLAARGQEAAPGLTLRIARVRLIWKDDRNVLSPDGKSRLVASANTARLWEADRRRPIGPRLEHKDRVDNVAFSPDGKYVATGAGSEAGVWDGAKGVSLGRFPVQKYWSVSTVAISPDNKWVAAGTFDLPGDTGEVWVWEIVSRKVIGKFKGLGPVRSVSFSDDGLTVLVAAEAPGGR